MLEIFLFFGALAEYLSIASNMKISEGYTRVTRPCWVHLVFTLFLCVYSFHVHGSDMIFICSWLLSYFLHFEIGITFGCLLWYTFSDSFYLFVFFIFLFLPLQIAELRPLQKKFMDLKAQLELKSYDLKLFQGRAEQNEHHKVCFFSSFTCTL